MRRRALALAAVAAVSTPARAQTAACDPAALHGPALTDCLNGAAAASEHDLQAAVEAAFTAIATRPGVFDSQRARWKNAFADSQRDWVRFRNGECQNVAPFEGQVSTSALQNRVAAFDAKLICTVRLNAGRVQDLAGRYGQPQP